MIFAICNGLITSVYAGLKDTVAKTTGFPLDGYSLQIVSFGKDVIDFQDVKDTDTLEKLGVSTGSVVLVR